MVILGDTGVDESHPAKINRNKIRNTFFIGYSPPHHRYLASIFLYNIIHLAIYNFRLNHTIKNSYSLKNNTQLTFLLYKYRQNKSSYFEFNQNGCFLSL